MFFFGTLSRNVARYLQFTNKPQNDGVMPYVDWAIEQGFGVIDINVPHYNSQPEVSCNPTTT